MNQEVFDKLVTSWSRFFFTGPMLILLFLLCTILAVLNNYRERERTYFLIYFCVGVSLFASSVLVSFSRYLSGRDLTVYIEGANTVFELIEFIAFYFFFKKCLQNRYIKKASKILLIALSIVFSIFFIKLVLPVYSTENIQNHSLLINTIDFFFFRYYALVTSMSC